MARTPEWQRRFDGFDFSDFAQEFLRRNPDYRTQFVRFDRGNTGTTQSLAARRSARPWGLEFPRRSRSRSRCVPGFLASRTQSERHPGRTFDGV
ncbi:transcriptional regulator domain-containing protein [Pelagerythrobacter aerophilus]